MELLNILGFFELGTINTLDMFYALFVLHLVLTIILNVISKEHQKAFFFEYHILEPKREKYDWDRLVKIRKQVFLFMLLYSAIVIVFTHLFGILISDIGIFIGAILYVVGLSFGDTKKNKKVLD